MNEINFSSLKELYKRIKPALYSKVQELRRNKIDYIKEEDVWNYLTENDWKNRNNLTLADMIDDILKVENDLLKSYVLEILRKEAREIKDNDTDLL